MRASAALLLAVSVTPALAVHAVSRFDAGIDGWTLEGPGTLEWVATGGNSGGHLKVTRTGPGEVWLVAPAQFHGNWTSAGTVPLLRHGFSSDTLSTTTPGRGVAYEASGPAGVVVREQLAILCPAQVWAGIGIASNTQPSPVFANVTRLRFRVGLNPALPVGEVIGIDNLQFRSCYANCDGSTGTPSLTANDFACFLQAILARDPYALGIEGRCGVSADDYIAFLSVFASGCDPT